MREKGIESALYRSRSISSIAFNFEQQFSFLSSNSKLNADDPDTR